jgi:hypothetical protein
MEWRPPVPLFFFVAISPSIGTFQYLPTYTYLCRPPLAVPTFLALSCTAMALRLVWPSAYGSLTHVSRAVTSEALSARCRFQLVGAFDFVGPLAVASLDLATKLLMFIFAQLHCI